MVFSRWRLALSLLASSARFLAAAFSVDLRARAMAQAGEHATCNGSAGAKGWRQDLQVLSRTQYLVWHVPS